MKKISIKGLAIMALTIMLMSNSASTEAANFHSISDIAGVVQQVQQIADTTRTNSQRSSQPIENHENQGAPSAIELAGIRKVTQDTVSDFVYGSKADYNVVGNLRRPEADVLTINPWSGVVCQYTIDTPEDFVEFLKFYVKDGYILIMDTQKAIRGFSSAARAIRPAPRSLRARCCRRRFRRRRARSRGPALCPACRYRAGRRGRLDFLCSKHDSVRAGEGREDRGRVQRGH